MSAGATLQPKTISTGSVSEVHVRTSDFQPRETSLGRRLPAKLAAMVLVPIYRIISVGVLFFILIGLASYLSLTIFYFFNTNWIAPRIISPTDEHVLQTSNQLSQGILLREKLSAEKTELLVKLRAAKREMKTHRDFTHQWRQSAALTVQDNLNKFGQVNGVAGTYQSETPKILDSDKAFSSSALSEIENLYKSHLISEAEYISRKAGLAQVNTSALALQRDSVELDKERNLLRRDIESYRQVLEAKPKAEEGLSYDVLKAKKDLEESTLQIAKAQDLSEALVQEVDAMDNAITRQDRVLHAIRNSPYLKAAEDKLTVAFVPYSNAAQTKPGSAVYACSLLILVCKQVGQVADAQEGEITDRHPFYHKDLRGILVRLELTDPKWTHSPVLFVKSPPLFF